jgi:hypothetical protein
MTEKSSNLSVLLWTMDLRYQNQKMKDRGPRRSAHLEDHGMASKIGQWIK